MQVLAIYDRLAEVDCDAIVQCTLYVHMPFLCLLFFVSSIDVRGLQQPDGSFAGDVWGEIDTRFSYIALSIMSLLGRLDAINVPNAVSFVLSCRNFDGGFGSIPGAESHSGQGTLKGKRERRRETRLREPLGNP